MAVLYHRTSHQHPHHASAQSGRHAETEAARTAVNDLRTRKDQLRNLYVSGEVSVDDYLSGNRLIDQRMLEARTRLAATQLRLPAPAVVSLRERRFPDLVDLYCDPRGHEELRALIRHELVTLAVTPGTHLRKWRTTSEIVATWRDAEDLPASDIFPVGSPVWADAQVRMAAARSIWAEKRLQRKADLISRHEEATAALKREMEHRRALASDGALVPSMGD